MDRPTLPCQVIVIGASAGGVEALSDLFATLPSDIDAAILVVLHLADHSISRLSAILERVTPLPVDDAVDGAKLECGHVYVAIADHQLTVEGGTIRVLPSPREGLYRPCIDTLFRSAASTYGARVVGVVLSGMLCDGTDGLRHITAGGGVSIVQDPKEAAHAGMPESALLGDHVGYCLPAKEIGALLGRIASKRPPAA